MPKEYWIHYLSPKDILQTPQLFLGLKNKSNFKIFLFSKSFSTWLFSIKNILCISCLSSMKLSLMMIGAIPSGRPKRELHSDTHSSHIKPDLSTLPNRACAHNRAFISPSKRERDGERRISCVVSCRPKNQIQLWLTLFVCHIHSLLWDWHCSVHLVVGLLFCPVILKTIPGKADETAMKAWRVICSKSKSVM